MPELHGRRRPWDALRSALMPSPYELPSSLTRYNRVSMRYLGKYGDGRGRRTRSLAARKASASRQDTALSGGTIYICILRYGADNGVPSAVIVPAEGGTPIDTRLLSPCRSFALSRFRGPFGVDSAVPARRCPVESASSRRNGRTDAIPEAWNPVDRDRDARRFRPTGGRGPCRNGVFDGCGAWFCEKHRRTVDSAVTPTAEA